MKKIFLLFLAACSLLASQAQNIKEPDLHHPEWSQDYPPFRIAGNLYYVGTYDLASYLISTPGGLILINTGLRASGKLIEKHIRALGFRMADIKILLTTQAHFDHLGAMAAIKKKTGARFLADAAEKEVLESGGDADYALGGHGASFAPLQADAWLNDGDTIALGGMQLQLLHHPGHTRGSCSYLFTVKDEQRSYRVLIANMPTIVAEKPFAELTSYPGVAKDYAITLARMKTISFDLWLASHASQFSMHDKHKPGDAYNPMAFADQKGYLASLEELQKAYDEKIRKDGRGN